VTLGKNGVEKTREGDQKTPIGVYHVTRTAAQKLTDFYGAGAFHQLSNEWDRSKGRNGHGIWLHGTPSRSTAARHARATLHRARQSGPPEPGRVPAGGLTPVIIADRSKWSDAGAVEAERSSLAGALEQWRADWASRDNRRYMAHYSPASTRVPGPRRLGQPQRAVTPARAG